MPRAFAPDAQRSRLRRTPASTTDQWTFGVRGLMPMHRIALGDATGHRHLRIGQTAEVVQETTSSGRRWGMLGAVLHWIYFTPFRRIRDVVGRSRSCGSSIAGTHDGLTGLFWGLWRCSPSPRYRLKREPSRTPVCRLDALASLRRTALRHHHHHVGVQRLAVDGSVGLASEHGADQGAARGLLRRRVAAGSSERRIDRAWCGCARGVLGSAGQGNGDRAVLGRTVPSTGAAGSCRRSARLGASRSRCSIARRCSRPRARRCRLGRRRGAVWLDRYDAYYYDRDGAALAAGAARPYVGPQRYVALSRSASAARSSGKRSG